MACDYGTLDDLHKKGLSQADAQIYYACKHFEAVQQNLIVQAIIAAAQTAAQIYFADKQYKNAKQAQDRLDRIAEEQLATAANLRNQYQYGMACERTQVDDACDISVLPPDYAAIRARIAAPIRAMSTRRRFQAHRCASINNMPTYCDMSDKVLAQETREIARACEVGFRREEALYEIRKKSRLDYRMNVLQHMRGLNAAASSALAGAQAAAVAAAGINPYAGLATAVNAGFGRLSGLTSQYSTASAAQGMGSYGDRSGGSVGSQWGDWNKGAIQGPEFTPGNQVVGSNEMDNYPGFDTRNGNSSPVGSSGYSGLVDDYGNPLIWASGSK